MIGEFTVSSVSSHCAQLSLSLGSGALSSHVLSGVQGLPGMHHQCDQSLFVMGTASLCCCRGVLSPPAMAVPPLGCSEPSVLQFLVPLPRGWS